MVTFILRNTRFFLYREDFEKFVDGLLEVISYIDQNQQDDFDSEIHSGYEAANSTDNHVLQDSSFVKDYTNVDFDDLSN